MDGQQVCLRCNYLGKGRSRKSKRTKKMLENYFAWGTNEIFFKDNGVNQRCHSGYKRSLNGSRWSPFLPKSLQNICWFNPLLHWLWMKYFNEPFVLKSEKFQTWKKISQHAFPLNNEKTFWFYFSRLFIFIFSYFLLHFFLAYNNVYAVKVL